jgi:glycosyltransferase involved in cell wall biosynthesis
MRFIILTQYYPPETGAPQNRLSDMARRLKKAGHEVWVLTAKPNYPCGVIHPGFERGLWIKSQQDGIPVIHCWIYPTRSKRIIFRLLNYFSFVICAAIVGIFTLPKADILLAESPPLFISLTAYWLSRIKHAKMIFNVSDLYPDTAISLGMLKQIWLQKLFYLFEAWSYKMSSAVTGQTEGIVSSIRKRFPKKPVFLLTNGVDIDYLLANNELENKKTENEFIIGYAGILGYAQNLNTVIQTAHLIQDQSDIQFHLYGDGPLRDILCEQIDTLGLKNVKVLGHRSHDEIIKLLPTWNVGLVPLANTPLMAGALPSKMFEVMGARLPVLLSAPQGEASNLILRANAGVWVQPESPKELAEAILDLYNDRKRCQQLGHNGLQHVIQFYDRGKIIESFVSFLKQQGVVAQEVRKVNVGIPVIEKFPKG